MSNPLTKITTKRYFCENGVSHEERVVIIEDVNNGIQSAVQWLKEQLGGTIAPYYGHHYNPDGSMPDYSEDGYLLHKEVLDLINMAFPNLCRHTDIIPEKPEGGEVDGKDEKQNMEVKGV